VFSTKRASESAAAADNVFSFEKKLSYTNQHKEGYAPVLTPLKRLADNNRPHSLVVIDDIAVTFHL